MVLVCSNTVCRLKSMSQENQYCCHYCHPNSLVNLLFNSRITQNVKYDSKMKLKLFVE